jgi:outer membrane protein assembly factor BamB
MKIKNIIFVVLFCLSLLLTASIDKKPLWKIQQGAECAGSPAASAGSVIMVTKNGMLGALDSAGTTLWQQMLPAGCLAAPAIAPNNDIYVACIDGSLLRISAEGKTIWRINLEQELLATPLLATETLFAVSSSGRVWRIGQKDGVILNKLELQLPVHASPIWDARKRNLLVPVKDFYLLALNQELQVLWKFKTLGVIASSPAVTPKNEIYLTSMDRHLYKLTAAGRLLWKYKARGWLKGSPVIDEKGRVYFGGYDKYFYAVNMDGKLLWRFLGKASFTAGAALDAAGNVYCGDTSGTVYALDRNGKLAWRYKSEDFITADMAILPEKILLAGSIDGTLLAFKIERPLSRKAWWAKYLGNLRNSGYDEQ